MEKMIQEISLTIRADTFLQEKVTAGIHTTVKFYPYISSNHRWLREERGIGVYVEPTVRKELLDDNTYFKFVQSCEKGWIFYYMMSQVNPKKLFAKNFACHSQMQLFIDPFIWYLLMQKMKFQTSTAKWTW